MFDLKQISSRVPKLSTFLLIYPILGGGEFAPPQGAFYTAQKSLGVGS